MLMSMNDLTIGVGSLPPGHSSNVLSNEGSTSVASQDTVEFDRVLEQSTQGNVGHGSQPVQLDEDGRLSTQWLNQPEILHQRHEEKHDDLLNTALLAWLLTGQNTPVAISTPMIETSAVRENNSTPVLLAATHLKDDKGVAVLLGVSAVMPITASQVASTVMPVTPLKTSRVPVMILSEEREPGSQEKASFSIPTMPRDMLRAVSSLNDEPKVSALPGLSKIFTQVTSPLLASTSSNTSAAMLTDTVNQAGSPMRDTPVKLDLQNTNESVSQQLSTVLGERLQVQINHRVQHATIRLDPPNMGKIEIAIQVEGGKLEVNIHASQNDIYRALQHVSQELRNHLTEQNFMQVNVHIFSQQQRQDRGKQAFIPEEIQDAQQIENVQDDIHNDDSILMTV